MKSIKKISGYIGIFAATVGILWLLLILTSLIPNNRIRENIKKSALSYKEKEAYVMTNKNRLNSIEDNYADAILLGVIWNIDSHNPVVSSLDTKYYDEEKYGQSYGLYLSVTDKSISPNTDYTRYWHGMSVILRPLLLITDIGGIRNICFSIFLLLFAIICALLIKRKCYYVSVGLLMSLLGVQVWNIRLSVEYISTFLVCFLMAIVFILFEKKGNDYIIGLSVVSGVTTAFFDFLTTETITILIPLMLVFMIRQKENRQSAHKENIWLIIKSLLLWGISYVMTFIVKWSAASIATGQNKFITAMTSVEERVYGDTGEELSFIERLLSAVPANISTLFGGKERIDSKCIFAGLMITFAIGISVFYLFRKNQKEKDITVLLLIIGIVPYARYMVLSNHSYLHEFFTYRSQCVTILALLGIIGYNIDNPLAVMLSGKKKGRKKRRKS